MQIDRETSNIDEYLVKWKERYIITVTSKGREVTKPMYQFYDPSLHPIVTTDIDGNILNVRTRGLHYYGIPDIILEEEIDEYEMLFYAILDKVFKLKFDINESWSFNGRIFRFELRGDGLAHIVFPKADDVKIITIMNPFSGEPAKYRTKGMCELFNHPEAEVDGETVHGKEILSYLVDQVKQGEVYDDECLILYEDHTYELDMTMGRMGKPVIVLRESIDGQQHKQTIRDVKNMKRKNNAGHLKRIK